MEGIMTIPSGAASPQDEIAGLLARCDQCNCDKKYHGRDSRDLPHCWLCDDVHEWRPIKAVESQAARIRELEAAGESALKQAEMWYERYWYADAALHSAAEELRSSGLYAYENQDIDDVKASLTRGAPRPTMTTRLQELRALLTSPKEEKTR